MPTNLLQTGEDQEVLITESEDNSKVTNHLSPLVMVLRESISMFYLMGLKNYLLRIILT
jgi:hypothetical protein